MSIFTRIKNLFTPKKISYKMTSSYLKDTLNFYNFNDEVCLKHFICFGVAGILFSTTLLSILLLFQVPVIGVVLFTSIFSTIAFGILIVFMASESKPYTTYFFYWVMMKLSKRYNIFNDIDNNFKKRNIDKKELGDFVKTLSSYDQEIFAKYLAKNNFKSFTEYDLLKISFKEDFRQPIRNFNEKIDSILRNHLQNYNKVNKKERKLEKAREILNTLKYENEKIILSDKNKYEIKEPETISLQYKEKECV